MLPRSVVGSFVFSFVGSRSGLPEFPVATGGLSEVPVAPSFSVPPSLSLPLSVCTSLFLSCSFALSLRASHYHSHSRSLSLSLSLSLALPLALSLSLVSKLVEAISFSNVASFGGGFVCFSFVVSRSGIPEDPEATGGLSEVPVTPGAAVLRSHWLPERPF